jgi:O-methyltransferase involved in polyketide biosynthesis
MRGQVKVNPGAVQKTLFLPLWGRAEESRKQKPLLVDETAIRIIEQVDFDFSQIIHNIDDLIQIAWKNEAYFMID